MQNKDVEIATFASGCFWCGEALFKRLKGVLSVESGYSGGSVENPTYEQVKSGETGHAEAIQIMFDPQVISYDALLDVFWRTHDPTTFNRQGNDVGSQYRSVVFYHNAKQRKIAQNSKEKLLKEGIYKDSVVTEIVPYANFYPAESYHKNYYERNKDYPYCALVIDPKIQKLLKKFKKDIKEEYLYL